MLIQTALKYVGFVMAGFLSVLVLTGCNGEDTTLDENPGSEDNGEQILVQYVVTELDLEGIFDPQKIQVDAERGVIFVPQGRLGDSQNRDTAHLRELDLASGLPLQIYGIVSRLPSKHVVVSSAANAVASAVEVGNSLTDISIVSRIQQADIDFDVDHLIGEIKFNDQYLFALNEARNQIHQYDVSTGKHLGQINDFYVDDWLITQRASKLYVLSNSEVTEYDFSQGVAVNYTRPLFLSSAAVTFGWLNPDETHLYQSDGEVLTVPEFETLTPDLFSLSNARRFFVDIAFVPNSDKHYTIESYSGTDGDVFLSPLANNEAKPLGLSGRRIFVTSAGVHLYAYEDGKHKLYTLEQSNENEYETGVINIAPRLIRRAFISGPYTAYDAIYSIGLYSKAWPDLFLRFDAPSRNDLYHGEQIIIEPICLSEGCTSGAYSAKIPPNSQSIHVTVRLADWIQVNDFRGLVGFRVRTPEGSWNDFDLQNVTLTNIDPAGCVDITDTTILVFCDD